MQHYALIGDPVAHSLSPGIYRELFARYDVDADFSLIRIPAGRVEEVLGRELSGFACTMPHKQAIIPYLSYISPEASAMGSVNIVRRDKRGLSGFSTDAQGLLCALSDMGADIKHTAVMGTGGAARAAIYALIRAGADVTVFGRNAGERARLCAGFHVSDGGEYPCSMERFTLYINATPLGMGGRDEYASLDFLAEMPQNSAVYDMVYFPENTRLVKRALELGKNAQGGLSMLYNQAYLAFELWTGIRAAPLSV